MCNSAVYVIPFQVDAWSVHTLPFCSTLTCFLRKQQILTSHPLALPDNLSLRITPTSFSPPFFFSPETRFLHQPSSDL